MLHEKLTLYYYPNRTDGVADIVETARQYKLDLTAINFKEKPQTEAQALSWVEENRDYFPLLRLGDDRIHGFFFAPRGSLLVRLFGDTLDNRSAPTTSLTIYTTGSCGGCRALMQWLNMVGQSYTEINIEDVDGMAERLVQWSGGRRVVPTVEFEHTARLFNPGIPLMSRYLAKR